MLVEIFLITINTAVV